MKTTVSSRAGAAAGQGRPYERIAEQLGQVIVGQERAIRLLLAAFVSGGHVLLEDNPGTGKTTLAKALAQSVDAGFKRIQFTPDLLPSDVLGVSVFNPTSQTFDFHRGPVFSNIVLADEINRASPRTQSALLEAMAERQVSLDGLRHDLEALFFVMATQNPIEYHGTYPLPEAQMDRFALKFSLGYVSPGEEVSILSGQQRGHPLDDLVPCVGMADVLALREAVLDVRVSGEIKSYIVDLSAATRTAEGVRVGASPRASLAMLKCAQALALFDGQAFVSPDHVQELVLPVLAHRLIMEPQAKYAGQGAEQVVTRILEDVPTPK